MPRDPELEVLIDAFERGDYAHVREHAESLAANTSDPEVAAAARDLRRRIDPDPLTLYLLAASVALLVFLVIWAYLKQDTP
jgi:hypothetical protein